MRRRTAESARRRPPRRRPGGLALGAPLAGALLALALVASARAVEGAVYRVIGTRGSGLLVHTAPNAAAPKVTVLPDGTRITIVCQTRGSNVARSTMWDRIDRPVHGYLSDWYTTTPAVNAASPGLAPCRAPKTHAKPHRKT